MSLHWNTMNVMSKDLRYTVYVQQIWFFWLKVRGDYNSKTNYKQFKLKYAFSNTNTNGVKLMFFFFLILTYCRNHFNLTSREKGRNSIKGLKMDTDHAAFQCLITNRWRSPNLGMLFMLCLRLIFDFKLLPFIWVLTFIIPAFLSSCLFLF